MKKLVGLAMINLVSAALLISILSPGLFGVFSRPPLMMLAGLIVGFAVLAGCLLADYRLLFKKRSGGEAVILETDDEDRPAVFTKLLKQCLQKELFKKDLLAGMEQIGRFEKKQETVRMLLGGDKENAEKCLSILDNIADVFYQNVKSLVTRAAIFDEEEYQLFLAGRLELATPEAKAQKGELYQSLARYVDELTNRNEEILLQVDKLTAELTRVSTESRWDAETMLAMRRLDEYTQLTKQTQDMEKEVGETVWSKIRNQKTF